MPNHTTNASRTHKRCYCRACPRRDELLPLSEFNKLKSSPDGHARTCRSCASNILKKWRSTDEAKEKNSAYQRYFRTTEKGRATDARGKQKYRKTEKGRANDAMRRQRDGDKMKARYAMNRAVKQGILPRPASLPCVGCGQAAKEYHHHLGYEPEHHLSVVPVCKMCHARFHHSATG